MVVLKFEYILRFITIYSVICRGKQRPAISNVPVLNFESCSMESFWRYIVHMYITDDTETTTRTCLRSLRAGYVSGTCVRIWVSWTMMLKRILRYGLSHRICGVLRSTFRSTSVTPFIPIIKLELPIRLNLLGFTLSTFPRPPFQMSQADLLSVLWVVQPSSPLRPLHFTISN